MQHKETDPGNMQVQHLWSTPEVQLENYSEHS